MFLGQRNREQNLKLWVSVLLTDHFPYLIWAKGTIPKLFYCYSNNLRFESYAEFNAHFIVLVEYILNDKCKINFSLQKSGHKIESLKSATL